jgi:hypothetical protein
MSSKTATVLAAAAALLLLPAGAQAASTCTTTTAPGAAAAALYGAGTELVRTEQVDGLQTALVLEPRIAPGTRRRMVRTSDGWCDAAAGFNRAWKGAADGAATAAAYAKLAAAPYFDGVTVRSVETTAAGAHVVTTHARTNGVVARWVVTTDAKGVRSATWTATQFAVEPLEAQTEGLTALPGASERYARVAGGLLEEARGLPTVERAHREAQANDPSVPAVYTSPDGFKIRVSVGDTRLAADPGTSTGVFEADFVQRTMSAIRLNYQEFYDWGLRKGWEADLDPALPDTGWVYLNNALSAYCLACVFIANDFQIHMSSEITKVLGALGFNGYKDERDAYDDVLGHEMFHNFQNAYNNPGPLGRSAGRGVSTAYSEGTARFQETLHSYADVSFTERTLVTGKQANPPGLSLDANHCNGYGNDEVALAAGPFPKTYNACYFWSAWYTQHGLTPFVELVKTGFPKHATAPSNQAEGLHAIDEVSDVPVADQLAWFAEATLTGKHRKYAPASGADRTELDWGSFFFRHAPPALAAGESAGRSVGGGGVFMRRLAGAARVSLSGAGLKLYEVRSDTGVRALDAGGADVAAAAPGETVWVVAVNPTPTAVTATLSAR